MNTQISEIIHDAFISYSHKYDRPVAQKLQKVMQRLGKPWYRLRALRVFRDETSLTAEPELWSSIEKALSQTKYLILFASPEAADSKWVEKEVDFWLTQKSRETLLLALTDGELSWNDTAGDFDWTGETPLPNVLKGQLEAEPLWIDLREYRGTANSLASDDDEFERLVAGLAAKVHGMAKENLLSDEVLQQRRTIRLATSAVVLLAGLSMAATWAGITAYFNQQEALRQRDAALLNQSRFLASRAEEASQQGDHATAMLLALAGLRDETVQPDGSIAADRPYSPLAERSLATALSENRELAVFGSNEGPLGPAIVDPGGRRVASIALRTGQLRIWDIDAETELSAPEMRVTSAAFIGKGDRIVVGTKNKELQILESDTGQVLKSWRGADRGSIADIAVSPNGGLIAAVVEGPQMEVKLWDARTGDIRDSFLFNHGSIHSLQFLSDGVELLVAHDYGVQRLKWEGKPKTNSVMIERNSSPNHVGFSGDGAYVLESSTDQRVRVFMTFGGRKLLETPQFESGVSKTVLSPDRQHLATLPANPDDHRVRILSMETGETVAVLGGHDNVLKDVEFHADGQRLITTSEDGTLRVWALFPKSDVLRTFDIHSAAVKRVSFNPDGSRFVTASADGKAIIFEVATGKILHVLEDQGGAVNSAMFSGGGELVATVHAQRGAGLWDGKFGGLRERFERQEFVLPSMADPKSRSVVTISGEKLARIWVDTGEAGCQADHSASGFYDAAISPDDSMIATASRDQKVQLWDVTTCREIPLGNPIGGRVFSLAFNHDGTRLATGANDGRARVYDVSSGSQILELSGHGEPLSSVAFSSGAFGPRRLVTASRKGQDRIRVWDVQTGEQIASFSGWGSPVRSVQFSPDNTSILAAVGSAVMLISVNPSLQDIVNKAKKSVPRCFLRESDAARFVSGVPARWCITGAGGAVRDEEPNTWRPKYGYRQAEWRPWLTDVRQ